MLWLSLVLLISPRPWPSAPPSPSARLTGEVASLASRLAAGEAVQRSAAERALLAVGPPAVEPLLELSASADPATRKAIRSLLPRFGPEAIEPLYWAAERLAAWGPDERRRAIRDEAVLAVANMAEPALPKVLELMDRGWPGQEVATSPSPWQSFGIAVLARMGAPGRAPLRRLLHHPDPVVRASASALLGNVPDSGSADALLEGLSSADGNVRMYSAHGLGEMRDRRAVDPLLAHLSDPDWGTRRAAAAALAKMYDRRFLRPLVRLARGDPEVLVRQTTAQALIQWTGDPIAARLGRRYLLRSVSPAMEHALDLSAVLRLLSTAAVIYTLAWAGVKLSRGRKRLGVPSVAWVSAAAIGLLAFLWGRVFVELSGLVEWVLLLGVVPGTAWVIWWAGAGLKGLRVPALGCLLSLGLILLASVVGMAGGLMLVWLVPRVVAGFMILALVLAWWSGRSTAAADRAPYRPVALVAALVFYAGYGLGWLALWGHLGGGAPASSVTEPRDRVPRP